MISSVNIFHIFSAALPLWLPLSSWRSLGYATFHMGAHTWIISSHVDAVGSHSNISTTYPPPSKMCSFQPPFNLPHGYLSQMTSQVLAVQLGSEGRKIHIEHARCGPVLGLPSQHALYAPSSLRFFSRVVVRQPSGQACGGIGRGERR